ncbi:hypothetical protein ACFX2I_035816 [Malus domestica]
MVVKDVVSWTPLCSCYVNCGMPRQGSEAFREMGLNGDKSETQCSNSFFNPTCLLGVERFEFGKSDSWVFGQTWNGRECFR